MFKTTIFVYDPSGRLVAEYETEIAQPSTAQVSYLTNDHLGNPRITTDKDKNVFSRRDFMPLGEEITSEVTSQRSVNLNYGEDTISFWETLDVTRAHIFFARKNVQNRIPVCFAVLKM